MWLIKNHSNICNQKPIKVNSVHSALSPSCLFVLQEYPGKVRGLWRSIFVVLAQIEHVLEREHELAYWHARDLLRLSERSIHSINALSTRYHYEVDR